MSNEVCAGAIIFHKNTKIEYLLLHSKSGHWDFPKGHIEEGEGPLDTAKREVEEEIGIKELMFIEGFSDRISYSFKAKGHIIFKEVIFFLAESRTKNISLSYERKEFKWAVYKDAINNVTFKNSKNILEKAQKFLENQ